MIISVSSSVNKTLISSSSSLRFSALSPFLTEEETDIIIGTKFGYAVRFNQSAVRGMSRIATGVKGVNLREGDTVVGASVITDQQENRSFL